MPEQALKAYAVATADRCDEEPTFLVFAQTPGRAKSEALRREDCYADWKDLLNLEYTNLRAVRAPSFDNLAGSDGISDRDYFGRGWLVQCSGCFNMTSNRDDSDCSVHGGVSESGQILCADCLAKEAAA